MLGDFVDRSIERGVEDRNAKEIAELAGYDPELVIPVTTAEYPTPAVRPANSVLESARLGGIGIDPLPDYHGSLVAAIDELRD